MYGLVQENHPRLYSIHCFIYASKPLDGDTSLPTRLHIFGDIGAEHASGTKVCWQGYILSRTGHDRYVTLWYTISIVFA
jgi:hypothetical protein